MKISLCMMQNNLLTYTAERVREMKDIVDRIIIVDGGSMDDSILFFRNYEGVELYVHPWNDCWPEQRNKYLQHAREGEGTDWVIVLDPDEQMSPCLRKNLRLIVEKAEELGAELVPVGPHDISMEGDKVVHETTGSDFRKMMIYKDVRNVKYVGTVHEGIHVDGGWRRVIDISDMVKILANEGKLSGDDANPENYFYNHIKQNNVTWIRDIRYFVAGGGGSNLGDRNPHWIELKEALAKDGTPHDSAIVQELMVRGEIGPAFRQWLIDHHDIKEVICDGKEDGCSEMRGMYKGYFRLYHPEEEPEELRGKDIS